MDSDDIRMDWEDGSVQVKEEYLSEDESLNGQKVFEKTDDDIEPSQRTSPNDGCYFFKEENNCNFDFKEEVEEEYCNISSHDQSNYLNFVAVISEPIDNEVMVSEDPLVASKVYIDENDEVQDDQIIEKKKKKRKYRGRCNNAFSLFSYATEAQFTKPERDVKDDNNPTQFANENDEVQTTEKKKRNRGRYKACSLFSYSTENTQCTRPERSEGDDLTELSSNSIAPQVNVEDQKRKEENFLECAVCGSKFVRKRSLQNHILSHIVETSQFKCEVCQVSFSTRTFLSRHLKIHGLKPYKCLECGVSFSERGSLYAHRKVHSAERPFVCNICAMNFKVKSVLKTHMLVHLDNERKFKASFDCNLCSQSFARKHLLQKHIRAHAYQQYKFALCPNRCA